MEPTGIAENFPHRVCINLDRRPERWSRMQERFAKSGLGPVDRFSAVDGLSLVPPPDWPESAGAYGCLQSHLEVVRKARAEGRESVLIMEDDVLFADAFQEEFSERVHGLPADWGMLFFGCLHHDAPVPVAPGISRLRASFSTFMYAIRHPVFDAFISVNTRVRCAVDRNNWRLQQRFPCYCFMPHLAWVDDSYSDAQGVATNHWYIRDSMVLRGEAIKDIEKRTAVILIYTAGSDPERGLRNLSYLAQHYGSLFSVLVVEQGPEPSRLPPTLPPGCDYLSLPKSHLEQWCAAALEHYAASKDYFIVNEGNVVCSRMEMRAGLSKSTEYDAVGSFATYIDLDAAASDRLLRGQEYSTESCRSRPRRGRFQEFFTATRETLLRLSKNGVSSPAALQTFDSPGSALCLYGLP